MSIVCKKASLYILSTLEFLGEPYFAPCVGGFKKALYVSVLLCTPHTECPFCYFYHSGVVNLLYVAAAISILGLLVNLMLLFSFCTVSRINKSSVL